MDMISWPTAVGRWAKAYVGSVMDWTKEWTDFVTINAPVIWTDTCWADFNATWDTVDWERIRIIGRNCKAWYPCTLHITDTRAWFTDEQGRVSDYVFERTEESFCASPQPSASWLVYVP